MKGMVKRLIKDRGFGFIDSLTLRNIFFHKSELVNTEFDHLELKSKVEFDVINTFRGTKAVNVKILSNNYN